MAKKKRLNFLEENKGKIIKVTKKNGSIVFGVSKGVRAQGFCLYEEDFNGNWNDKPVSEEEIEKVEIVSPYLVAYLLNWGRRIYFPE